LRNGGTTSPVANLADARGPQGLGEGGYSYRSQAYTVADRLLLRNARAEIQDNARIMMEPALAVRAYTVSQIKPLLDTQMRYKFLPQTVPSYSATEYFNILRKTFPEYAYKEATLNPTNP
jgi:hypothetical protein